MKTKPIKIKNIDEYIAGFPGEVREILEEIREAVRKAAPGAKEAIKYKMPAFTLEGNLVFFAAFKDHIGFYPPVAGSKELQKALAVYEGPKGSLKFPIDKPLPIALIRKVVKIRVKENLEKAEAKRRKK
jgi:uncharacterized protein YdhG (YjbR/CyaY superfamily)